MKASFARILALAKSHPWVTVAILGAVILAAYFINKNNSGSSSSGTTAADATGSGSGTGSVPDLSGLVPGAPSVADLPTATTPSVVLSSPIMTVPDVTGETSFNPPALAPVVSTAVAQFAQMATATPIPVSIPVLPSSTPTLKAVEKTATSLPKATTPLSTGQTNAANWLASTPVVKAVEKIATSLPKATPAPVKTSTQLPPTTTQAVGQTPKKK